MWLMKNGTNVVNNGYYNSIDVKSIESFNPTYNAKHFNKLLDVSGSARIGGLVI